MSERSRKLIEDLKNKTFSYAIDKALDGDFVTGYALCEDGSGNIKWNKDVRKNSEDLSLICPRDMRHKASIIIIPNK